MELVLHYMYVVAIKDSGAWQGDTSAELSMIGFWNLIVVWLKVSLTSLLIQRLFPNQFAAARTMEILPLVGTGGRHGSAREHGQVYGQ